MDLIWDDFSDNMWSIWIYDLYGSRVYVNLLEANWEPKLRSKNCNRITDLTSGTATHPLTRSTLDIGPASRYLRMGQVSQLKEPI